MRPTVPPKGAETSGLLDYVLYTHRDEHQMGVTQPPPNTYKVSVTCNISPYVVSHATAPDVRGHWKQVGILKQRQKD